MTPTRDTDKILDQAIEEVRAEAPSEEAVTRAAERVWDKLDTSDKLRSCADFQALIPAYRAGELSEGRHLLVDDHVRSCITCRRALSNDERAKAAAAARAATPRTGSYWKWGAAAAAVLVVFLAAQMGVFTGLFIQPAYALVEAANGPVYRMAGANPLALAQGGRIEAGESFRTARGVTAQLRLSDGSLVEVDERTQLSIRSAMGGNTIALRHGNIIVQAADQGRDHLFVDTDEFEVAVKGTVFSVGHGMKGSRVSVLEGEVLVEQEGVEQKSLKAGQQHTSRQRLASVEIAQEIEWSPNRDQHLALLAEIGQLQQEMFQVLDGPQLRFDSRLLAALPAGTAIFGAMPNISDQLQQVFTDFRNRIAGNPALSEWYTANVPPEQEIIIQLGLDRMRVYGAELGAEIVVALVDLGGDQQAPLLLAETNDEQGLRDLVINDVGLVRTLAGGEIPIQVVGSAAEATGEGLWILVENGFLLVSPSAELLAEASAAAAAGGSFQGSRFATTIESAYAAGVNWLLAANLQVMSGIDETVEQNAFLTMLGVREIQDLMIERKQVAGVTDNRAVMTFSGLDDGLLSWVAEPGPMGGLDFVSPDAHLAAAFVVDEPAMLVDRLFSFLQSSDEGAWNEVLQAQAELGLDIRNDLAAPMGGEMVIAIDGPVLPEPSWKLIAEVLDSATLQNSIVTIVDRYNARREVDDPEAILTEQEANHFILEVGVGPSIEYRFVQGYLIAGSSREVIDRAVQFRQTGYTLSTSAEFIDLLPQGQATSLSALFYNNLGGLLSPIAQQINEAAGETLSPEQEEALASVSGEIPATMVSLFAEPGRVTVASTGNLESLWFNLATLSGLDDPGGLAEIIGAGN